MLDDLKSEEYLSQTVVTAAGRSLIQTARSSEPLRNVSNRSGNFCGSFPSGKIRLTNPFESWGGERALLLLWEYDPDVYEVWAQAVSCSFNYVSSSGRKVGTRTVSDFLVLYKSGPEIVDFKTVTELQRLVVDAPGRWISGSNGTWDQPPVREHFESLGLRYRIVTDRDIPHILIRNLDFLKPRLEQRIELSESLSKKLADRLAEERRILISDAIQTLGDATLIYVGHFEGRWALNLTDEPIALPDSAYVYRDFLTLRAMTVVSSHRITQAIGSKGISSVRAGTLLCWDGRHYEVVNAGEKRLFLKGRFDTDARMVLLSREELSKLIADREVILNTPSADSTSTGQEILKAASEDTIEKAIHKLQELKLYWEGQPYSTPRRTLLGHQNKFRAAEQQYGNGFIGLLDRDDLKGNRSPRTDTNEQQCRQKAFEWLLRAIPTDPTQGYSVYASLCEELGASPVSEKTFLKAWNGLDEYEKIKIRAGKRAAYPQKAPRTTRGPHILQGPPEGDSPWQLVHIDHVQSNVFARKLNSTALLEKPWISIAIDAFTRIVLAFWISILSPSHASVMMVLRDMVRRHGRLPLYTITDAGNDLKATIPEQFLAQHGCGHGIRPSGEPRFGNPVERLNLDIDAHLSKTTYGGNEVLKKPRMSSRSHDPRTLANLTVAQLAIRSEELFFHTYPYLHHDGLKQTPNSKRDEASLLQGTLWGKPATYNEQLVFQTLTRARKHGGLMRMRDGIRLNGHNYFTSAISGHTRQKIQPPLYDPEDPTYIYARVDNRYVRAEMIDSQLRRLPPECDRRFYIDEQIFLSRPSSHKKSIAASHVKKGDFYRGNGVVDDPSPPPTEQQSSTPDSARTDEVLQATPAPKPRVSWRK